MSSPRGRVRHLLALGCGAALLPGSASAQMIPRSVEIDAFVGYYSFLSRGGFSEDETVKLENLRDQASWGARFGIHFTEWIAFEATLRMVKTATWDTWRDAWYVAPDFTVQFNLPFPYVVPYFFAGVGFQHYNIRPTFARGIGPGALPRAVRDPYSDTELRPQDLPYTYRSADGDFTVSAGGGAKFLLHERFGIRLDIRYLVSAGPGGPADGVPTLEPDPVWNDSFHHVDLSGGAFVLLGGGRGPDKDKDGIPNKIDHCVTEAEDRDNHEDEDGCPDVDNDKDGILDENDNCPNSPEDIDGFEDKDGCPDLDNDKDGITDDKDECRGKPEDDDGFEDKDGCPELDNDGDGLMDLEDKCRNNPETFNFFIDEDGCPDQVPSDLLEFAGAIPAIQFEVDSAKLLRSASPILDKAARAMLKYPDLSVEIAGHASSDGDDEHNMELSQGRTESVREYLIRKGVSSERLTARGYGETMPVASNDTEGGRRANRRVEFRFFGR